MVSFGPLLVTAMESYIHLIPLLLEIFCQCRVMCCNIHGPENTALILKYVQESFLTNKVKLLPFILSVTCRYLPFVPQAPDGCERFTFMFCRNQKTQRSAERLHSAQRYSCMTCPQLGEILKPSWLKHFP
jgi:hypothetical protein